MSMKTFHGKMVLEKCFREAKQTYIEVLTLHYCSLAIQALRQTLLFVMHVK